MNRADLLAGVVAGAVEQVAGQLELFAADAVRALIETLVDLAGVMQTLQEGLHPLGVPQLRRPDEVVVGDVEGAPDRAPLVLDQPVGPLLGRDVVRLGGAEHLLAVLVGAGQEPDLLPALAMPSGQDVAGHRRVGVPDVRHVVDVVDRRRQVEGLVGLGASVGVGHPSRLPTADKRLLPVI